MFVHLTVHRPRPGKGGAGADSMRGFAAKMAGASGLREVHTLRDSRSTALIGLAIWESREAYVAFREWLAAQPEDPDEPRDDWEEAPPQVFLLEEA